MHFHVLSFDFEYHRSSIMALGSLSHVFPDEALDFLLVVDGLSVVL
jgi:hypothetical protein